MNTTGFAVNVNILKSPVKGTLYVEVSFQTESDHVFPWRGYLTTSTMTNVVKALRACGYKGNGLEPLCDVHPDDVSTLLPNRVALVLKQDNGEMVVQWVNTMKEKPDASELAAFGGYFLESPTEARKTPKKPSNNGPKGKANTEDDKVPF